MLVWIYHRNGVSFSSGCPSLSVITHRCKTHTRKCRNVAHHEFVCVFFMSRRAEKCSMENGTKFFIKSHPAKYLLANDHLNGFSVEIFANHKSWWFVKTPTENQMKNSVQMKRKSDKYTVRGYENCEWSDSTLKIMCEIFRFESNGYFQHWLFYKRFDFGIFQLRVSMQVYSPFSGVYLGCYIFGGGKRACDNAKMTSIWEIETFDVRYSIR